MVDDAGTEPGALEGPTSCCGHRSRWCLQPRHPAHNIAGKNGQHSNGCPEGRQYHYGAARHELDEFGLVDVFDPMDRVNEKLSENQRQADMLRAPRITLKLDGFDFSRPAVEVVKAKLAKPAPPRWVERATTLGLLDGAGRFAGTENAVRLMRRALEYRVGASPSRSCASREPAGWTL
jgi:hypothetical protein